MVNVDVKPWIRHFEDQAVRGASVRSTANKHYIIVHPFKDTLDGGTEKQQQSGKGEKCDVSVVSSVQQGVEQAEEEVKKEVGGKEVVSEVEAQLHGNSSVSEDSRKDKCGSKRKIYALNGLKKCGDKKRKKKRVFVKDVFA